MGNLAPGVECIKGVSCAICTGSASSIIIISVCIYLNIASTGERRC